MKNVSNTLGLAPLICVLTACGGSSGDSVDTQSSVTREGGISISGGALISEDPSTDASISLAGATNPAAGADLRIENARTTSSSNATGTVEFQFDVIDSNAASINLDALSIALEVAAAGSFDDSYRQALFDIRVLENTGGQLSMSARASAPGLPTGSYTARLVVNPNWQNDFDVVPANLDQSQPFQFISESDYSNNASNTLLVDINSGMNCSEDSFENNDSLLTAAEIPVGGQIAASLCTDSVDFYSVQLSAGQSTSIYFDYADSGSNQASKYAVLDSSFNLIGGSVAREANDIRVSATAAGTYYLAIYGQRSSYELTREPPLSTGLPPNFANDFSNSAFFTADTIAGPNSWLLGDITLNKLAFSAADLEGQVVDCGRITTQFSNNVPVAYITPSHFADIYNFHFLSNGEYLIDGEAASGWSVVDGDISNSFWYDHDFPGYAEKDGEHGWRYWSADGLSYVDCEIEVN